MQLGGAITMPIYIYLGSAARSVLLSLQCLGEGRWNIVKMSWNVIVLTVGSWRAYAQADSLKFCFLSFSTRVVLLIFRSFAAFVLTPLLFFKASSISLFS